MTPVFYKISELMPTIVNILIIITSILLPLTELAAVMDFFFTYFLL